MCPRLCTNTKMPIYFACMSPSLIRNTYKFAWALHADKDTMDRTTDKHTDQDTDMPDSEWLAGPPTPPLDFRVGPPNLLDTSNRIICFFLSLFL